MQWQGEGEEDSLSLAQQLYIKRSKLDFKIILRESSGTAKFELFQRLNTGGAQLSDQEIRNAILVGAKPEFYRWLKGLADTPAFAQCVALSERSYLEQYDLEIVLRYLVLRNIEIDEARRMGDLGEFLTDRMMSLLDGFDSWRGREERIFADTFGVIANTVGQDAFRKYDAERSRFTRGFSISAYEVVAMGIGCNMERSSVEEIGRCDLPGKVKMLWTDDRFLDSSGSGVRASTRIPRTLELGRELFRP